MTWIGIYKWISRVTDPKVTYFVFLVFLLLNKFNNFYILICSVSIMVAMFFWTAQGEKKYGKFDDYMFNKTESQVYRYKTYTLTFFISLIFLSISFLYNAIFEIKFFTIACLLTIFLFFIAFRFKFKLSAHVAFNTLILGYFLSGISLFLSFIVVIIIIGLARSRTNKHSLKQIFLTSLLMTIILVIIQV